MTLCEVKFDNQTCCVMRFKGRCTVAVQPAGSAGERRVFLTMSGDGDTNKEIQIDFVISDQAAKDLGHALISGSVGITREVFLEGST